MSATGQRRGRLNTEAVRARTSLIIASLMVLFLLAACDRGDDVAPSPTLPPSATAESAQVAVGPTPVPQATQPPREVAGLFLDPRPSEPDAFVNVLPMPASPFTPWNDSDVFVYDLDTGTETLYGPGLIPSFSPDETRMAINVLAGGGPGAVRIVDIASGEVLQEFEYPGGLASFIDDNHLYLPGGAGQPAAHDLRTGERTPLDEVDDPSLRSALEGRASGAFRSTFEGSKYRLRREFWDYQRDPCLTNSGPDVSHYTCQAKLWETWTLEEVATGKVLLAFRAVDASPAGPGEFVLATSPQCEAADGNLIWCAEAIEALRAKLPPGEETSDEVHGTTNIFIVDIETGAAEFVATASFSATAFYSWPQNWPLSASESHVVWTGAYCSQESSGRTQIYDRTTGEIVELDGSFWVTITPRGDLGVGPFGPRAILDIEALEWVIVLPEGTGDVAQSSGGRYLARGGILGHGGLC